MRWIQRSRPGRLLMSLVLLLAFVPNALFMEHWADRTASAAEAVAEAEMSEATTHAAHQHESGNPPEPGRHSEQSSVPAQTHCHVGPESCAASSGLSNAIVISAALAMTLLGGGVIFLGAMVCRSLTFDLARKFIVPPRLNLLSV